MASGSANRKKVIKHVKITLNGYQSRKEGSPTLPLFTTLVMRCDYWLTVPHYPLLHMPWN